MIRLGLLVFFAGTACATDFASEAKPLKGVEAKPFEAAACGSKGCKTCPDGSAGPMEMRAVLYGNFVNGKSEDALITTGGCEAHVNNFGGAVLLTKVNGGWKKNWYEPGLIADRCWKARAGSGREIPYCLGGYTGQGEDDEILYTVDVNQPAEKRQKNVFGVADTTMTCGAELTAASIGKITGTANGVTVVAQYGKKKLTPAERKKCESAYAQGKEPEIEVPQKRYEVRFVWKGEALVLDEATRKAFQTVNSSQ